MRTGHRSWGQGALGGGVSTRGAAAEVTLRHRDLRSAAARPSAERSDVGRRLIRRRGAELERSVATGRSATPSRTPIGHPRGRSATGAPPPSEIRPLQSVSAAGEETYDFPLLSSLHSPPWMSPTPRQSSAPPNVRAVVRS
jgi:hypothetical protein